MGLRPEHAARQEALKTFPAGHSSVDFMENGFPSDGGLRFYRDLQLCRQQRVCFSSLWNENLLLSLTFGKQTEVKNSR